MTAAEIIKKKFTKEKLHRFIFGTREKQGVGKQLVVYALLICRFRISVPCIIYDKHKLYEQE